MSTTVVQVRDRPIMFSSPMVRAILDGRKTQTRRVVKPQPDVEVWLPWMECRRYHPSIVDRHGMLEPGAAVFGFANEDEGWPCQFGGPGDRLWVRESLEATDEDVWYVADGKELDAVNAPGRPRIWEYREGIISPIHMPRWASRITLEIVGVRVERVQDISHEDAICEGMNPLVARSPGEQSIGPRDDFRELWDHINGKTHPWRTNPWVWVIEFRAAGEGKRGRGA